MKKPFLILLLGILLLSGCGDNEQEARALYNQAIKQWDAGELEQADKLFQQIEDDYLDTVTATESIKERKVRIEKYKNNINLSQVERLNKGGFSQKVTWALADYHQDNHHYPEKLESLTLFNSAQFQPYLTGCNYKKALFNAGYSLNCLESDSIFEQKQREKHREQHNKKKKQPKPLATFPKANKTFGELMNPENALPKSGFFAYYYRMSEPNKIVHREQVSDIAISYAWNEFHGIDSEEFGAYWIGQVSFDKPVVKDVSVDLSWSSARVMINKQVVYDGKNNSRTIPVSFPAGKYLIEVEYSNGWHTTEFAVSFTDKKERLSRGEVKRYFRENKNILGDFELFYAGAYESGNKDLSIPLNILPSKKPIVLVLSSYSVVKWVINNPHNVEIKTIVIGSYDKGTEVRNNDKATQLLYAEGQLGGYQLGVKCQCLPNGNFHCDYDKGIATDIEQLTGHKLNGFSGKYGAKQFDIPDSLLNDGFRDALELKNEKIKKQRQACTKKYNPNFEHILQEYQ